MEALAIKKNNTDIVAMRDEATTIFFKSIDIKPRTAEAYKKSIKYFFEYLNNNNITTPTQSDIISYKNYLIEKHEAPSINLYLTAVKRLYKFLSLHYGIEDLTLELKGISQNRLHKKDGLTQKQIKDLLNLEMSKRDYAIIYIMLIGALREIEIARADIKDLTTKGNKYILKIQGKGHSKKDDYIFLTDKAYKVINDYLATRKNLKPSDPLFTSDSNHNSDGRLTTRSISRIVKNKLLAIGIKTPRITPHSIRHTATTLYLLNNNKNIFEAQKFARHSTPATTQIYIDEMADTEAKEKGADTIENILNEI